MTEATLYERLGERDAIAAVVDRFYERVLDDDRLAEHFADSDVEQLRDHQVRFIGSVTGGPIEYSGDDMRTAHEHLGLTNADFDAVAGHLEATLREFDVAERERSEVLEAVSALREDVVTA